MIGQELAWTAAQTAAQRNRTENLRALAGRQADLAREIETTHVCVEWVFARDGSLTAREAGAWWSGCSLPRRTAESLLKKMELTAPVACFLSPTHAGQVRVALDRMSASQALIAIVPDVRDLALMVGCEPFASEIAAGRLWFASGEGWAGELARVLIDNDGLATPGQFIRTGVVADEPVQAIIQTAQTIFAQEDARRAELIKRLLEEAPAAASDTVCAIAPSTFRLWTDGGRIVGEIARSAGWRLLDPDDPRSTSAVALARSAVGCGTLLTANAGRADLPSAVPDAARVISWITGPRIPEFDGKCANDALVLADVRWRDTAVKAGWPTDRLHVATWPRLQAPPGGSGLGVIADTLPLTTPAFDHSSQRILWEAIAEELSRNPFALDEDVAGYLARWAAKTSVAEETIDRAQFVEKLIVPAYQQSLVRCLVVAGLPAKLFGAGWDQITEFAQYSAGEIADPAALSAAASSCAALVHVWPGGWAHPIEFAGRPVVRRGTFTKSQWLSEARRLAAGESRAAAADNAPALTSEFIRRLCR